VKRVACPKCGTLTEYSPQNKWRPFCSERCRLIDLGKWASDEYRLPEKGSGQVPDEPEGKDPH
jgi:uncharacterized protein